MSAQVNTLEMIFTTAVDGRRVTLRVLDPKENLAGTEVKAVMEDIINKNVFTSTTGDLIGIYGARIVQRAVNPVEIPA